MNEKYPSQKAMMMQVIATTFAIPVSIASDVLSYAETIAAKDRPNADVTEILIVASVDTIRAMTAIMMIDDEGGHASGNLN